MDNLEELFNLTTTDKETEEEYLKLVSFKLGEEEYAFDINVIREIIKLVEITRVPKSPPFVQGVINLRGRVIPVLNLAKRMGIKNTNTEQEDSKIMIIESENRTIGLIVDSVSEVIEIPFSNIESNPIISHETESEFISGVGKLDNRLFSILDLEKILSFIHKRSE